MDWQFDDDGSIRRQRGGQVVAHIDDDGQTLRSSKYGTVIAYIESDGTIKSDRYGKELGFVDSNGTVKTGGRYGQKVGQVSAPRLRVQAALLLVL